MTNFNTVRLSKKEEVVTWLKKYYPNSNYSFAGDGIELLVIIEDDTVQAHFKIVWG